MAHAAHIEPQARKVGISEPRKKKGNLFQTVVNNIKAKSKAKKIMKALNEAEQIHNGKRKGKSFDDFLQEI